jgi:hypothetical protein
MADTAIAADSARPDRQTPSVLIGRPPIFYRDAQASRGNANTSDKRINKNKRAPVINDGRAPRR